MKKLKIPPTVLLIILILVGALVAVLLVVSFSGKSNGLTSGQYEILEESSLSESYYHLAVLIPTVSPLNYKLVVESTREQVLKECTGLCDITFYDSREAYDLSKQYPDFNRNTKVEELSEAEKLAFETLREHTIAITNYDVIGVFYYPHKSLN